MTFNHQMTMETQNKQWVCHPVLENSGQLGPEDLSSSSKNSQNQHQNICSKIVQNKNGLDQFFVQQIEDSICENSRQTILRILDEVSKLTSIEKLLLYLKLPTDITNISDPLRQPLNPLGSRTEISQTIMWIRTHLEEDPELSLPKQEVYNEYTIHCANNKMKPLSTADFGKVMKQVYPSVRPRRLGTRGNSRYCYAGLRKRFKLEVPQLPDLGDRPQSTETIFTQSELTSAACTIICEWAESILGTHFHSVHVLASYLVRHAPQNVNISSGAAALFVDFEGLHSKEITQELLPYSNHISVKHKEAQLHLQRKLQQRELKRKLQSPKTETKTKCKKTKLQSRTVSLDSVESNSPKSQGYQLSCDTSTNECTLPDFSSFQVKLPAEDNEKTTENISRSNSLENEIYADDSIKPNITGKLPIPRLPTQKMKNAFPAKSIILQAPKKIPRNQKYKAIQPKPPKTDENLEIQIAPDDTLKNTDYLTRERLISVSQVDKDALDDYLHGGNNSQEQEEELMQYFKNNNNTSNVETDEISNGSKSDKLSQLRLLLEQNLNSGIAEQLNAAKNIININNSKQNFPQSSTSTIISQNQVLQSQINPSSAKRRVSFETSVIENDPVPPSPNTRRKNFSFTPISPGPHSPKSKCSSTNASPFVSPRNTPVPRAKISHVLGSFVAQQPRKVVKPTLKHEPELYNEQEKLFGDLMGEKLFVNPTDIIPKCTLPMSAPPSPMLPYKKFNNSSNLLQKLLDSNSKVAYIPDYEKNPLSQEVTQLLSENNAQFNPIENYRSQSVPLHQMTSFKTMSPCLTSTQQTNFNFNFTSADNSVAPTPVPAEFSDFDTLTEINTGLNNENLNQILNILETTPNEPATTENVFNFDTNQSNELISVQRLIRSQSIDVDLGMRNLCSDEKFVQNQPSKSVPNTPLPFAKPKLDLNLNNNQAEAPESVFACRPINNEDFPSSLGFTINDNNFSARRNLSLLLEQEFTEKNEFPNS